jgi:hypothetical protein
MPSEANTASKDAPYLVSRSRMRNRNAEIRSPRSAMRLRAACVVHAIVGCSGDAEDVDAPAGDSMTNRT